MLTMYTPVNLIAKEPLPDAPSWLVLLLYPRSLPEFKRLAETSAAIGKPVTAPSFDMNFGGQHEIGGRHILVNRGKLYVCANVRHTYFDLRSPGIKVADLEVALKTKKDAASVRWIDPSTLISAATDQEAEEFVEHLHETGALAMSPY